MLEILVVDDNQEYLFLLKEALTISGYDVHTATDGVEACEKLTSTRVDLIVSDIRMPRLDGIKLHAFARETERYKRTKFVFITGFKDMYSSIPGFDKTVDFFLDKTAPINAIIQLVDRLVFGKFSEQWT
jgi:CheY-like chemotaxis protein